MMTPYKLENAIDAGDYYEDDDYYAKDSPEAMERTHWYGKGAQALRLSGYVEKERFVELLQGKLTNDIQLGRKRDGKIQHRPGYDLTFSAPKSISILAEVGGDTNLHYAHNKAVNVALDFVEKYIAMTRVSESKVTEFQHDVKCIFAKFRHDTSRSVTDDTGETIIDCQLHTHSVLLNALLCRDGVWRSLSSEKIYELQKTVGMIYRATLARLVVAYGYEITKTRDDGLFEIKGITREQIEGFSNRRLLITEVMKKTGVSGAAAAERITKQTREAKVEVDRALLHKEWVKRATEMQISYEVLIQNAKREHDKFDHDDYDFEQCEAKKSLEFAIAHLSETQSVFSRYQLIGVALAHGVGKFELDRVQQVINQAAEKRELIAVSTEKFTSPAVLQKEVEIIRRMKKGIDILSPVTAERTATLFVEQLQRRYLDNAEPGLTDGQQRAIQAILTCQDRYLAIQGSAGVGKSTLLAHVLEYMKTAKLPVRFFATTSSAVKDLTHDLGVEAKSLSHLIYNVRDIRHSGAIPEMWIIDEIGMASTDQICRLERLADKYNKRIVYMGDRGQGHSVENGDPYGLLQDNGMQTIIAKDIVRQRNADLKIAVKRTIAGDINSAFKKIGHNIKAFETREERCHEIARHYLSLSPEERQNAIIVVLTHAERDLINTEIRAALINDPDAKSITYNGLMNKSLTRAQKRLITQYEVGDRIRFNKAYRSIDVKKGEYLKVKAVDMDNEIVTLTRGGHHKVAWKPGGKKQNSLLAVDVYAPVQRTLAKGDFIRFTEPMRRHRIVNGDTGNVTKVTKEKITVEVTGGNKVVLDRRKGAHQHWDYAWSSTTAAGQGKTCDTVLGILDSHNRHLSTSRAFYVLISRAKYAAHLVVDNIDKVRQHLLRHHGANENALDYVASFEIQRRFSQGLMMATTKLQDRVIEVSDNNARLGQMATDYAAMSPRTRSQTVMMVPGYRSRKIVDALVRDKLISKGEISAKAVSVDCLERQFVKSISRAGDYHIGDVIRITDATKTLPVEKDGYYEIVELRERNHTLTLVNTDGEILKLNLHDFFRHKTNQLEVYQKTHYPVAVGDRLRFTRTHLAIGAQKDETVVVTAINENTISIKTSDGRVKTLNRDDNNLAHFEYAYSYRLSNTLPEYYRQILVHVDSQMTSPLQQAQLLSLIGTPIDMATVYTHSHAYLADRLNMHTGRNESLQAVQQRTGKLDTVLESASAYKTNFQKLGKAWGEYFKAVDENIPFDDYLTDAKALQEKQMTLARDVLAEGALSDPVFEALAINKTKCQYYADKLSAKENVLDYQTTPSKSEKLRLAYTLLSHYALHKETIFSQKLPFATLQQEAWQYAYHTHKADLAEQALLLADFDNYRATCVKAAAHWQTLQILKEEQQPVPKTWYEEGRTLLAQRTQLSRPLLAHRQALENVIDKMGLQEAKLLDRLAVDSERLERLDTVTAYSQARTKTKRCTLAASIAKQYEDHRHVLLQVGISLPHLVADAWHGISFKANIRWLPGEEEKFALLNQYFTAVQQTQKAWKAIANKKNHWKPVTPECYEKAQTLNRKMDALAAMIMTDKLTFQSLLHFKLPRSIDPFSFIEKHAARHDDYLRVIEYVHTKDVNTQLTLAHTFIHSPKRYQRLIRQVGIDIKALRTQAWQHFMDTQYDKAGFDEKAAMETLDVYFTAATKARDAWSAVFNEKNKIYTPAEEAHLLLGEQLKGKIRPASIKPLLQEKMQILYATVNSETHQRDKAAHAIIQASSDYKALLKKAHVPEQKLFQLIERHARSYEYYHKVKQYQELKKEDARAPAAYSIASHMDDCRHHLRALKVNMDQLLHGALSYVATTKRLLTSLSAEEKTALTTMINYEDHKQSASQLWKTIKTKKSKQQTITQEEYDQPGIVSDARNEAAHYLIEHSAALKSLAEKIQLPLREDKLWQGYAAKHNALLEVERFIGYNNVSEKNAMADRLSDNYPIYQRALRQHDIDAIKLLQNAWQHKKLALLTACNEVEKDWVRAVDTYLEANLATRKAWGEIADKEQIGEIISQKVKRDALLVTHARNTAAMSVEKVPPTCQTVFDKIPQAVRNKILLHADKGRARLENALHHKEAAKTSDWEYQARFEDEIRKSIVDTVGVPIHHEREYYDKDVVLDAVRANPEPVISQILGKAPNARLSKGHQLVWGEKGSVRYTVRGAKAGLISDFEQNAFGDAIHYYAKITGKAWKDALIDVAKMANVVPGSVKVELSSEEVAKRQRQQLANEKKATAKNARMRQYAIDGWETGVAIKGTPAEIYLREHRKITADLDKLNFRYQPRMKDFGTGRDIYRPALLVRARNNQQQLTTAQAIYLDPKTGKKANLEVNKRSFGSAEGMAAIVYAGGGDEVIIAEGPETCASIAEVKPKANIYSSLGRAATIGQYAYLCARHNTNKILIAADNDDADPKSTTWRDIKKAALELAKAGVEVSIAKPIGLEKMIDGVMQPVKTDFNDLLQEEGPVLVKQNLQPNFKVIDTEADTELPEKFEVVKVQSPTDNEAILKTKQKTIEEKRLPASVVDFPEKTINTDLDIQRRDINDYELDF